MKKLVRQLKSKKAAAALIVVIVAAGVAYKAGLTSAPAPVVKKVNGSIVALGEPFTLNLAGGRYGRVSVSLVLDSEAVPAAVAGADAPALTQGDLVRALVTDHLTGVAAGRLVDRRARRALVQKLLADLKKSTDVPVKEVLITDLAVQ